MNLTTGILPIWLKQALAVGSLLLIVAGAPAVFGFACITFLLVISEDSAATITGLISFILIMLTVGAGGVVFWHSTRSLQRKVSHPLRLPSGWKLLSIFGFLIIIGLVIVENDFALGILLPPILFGIAILPPLLALSWFIGNKPVGVSYRQVFVALAGGAMVSIFLTFIVVSMVVIVVFALVQNFASSLLDQLDSVNILEANSLSTLPGNLNYVYVFTVVPPARATNTCR